MPRLRTLAALAVVAAGVLSFTVKSHGQGVNRDEILQLATNAAPGKNLAAGRALFEKNCATCHRFGPIGTDVGPDLTTINSRFKKRDILESILFPVENGLRSVSERDHQDRDGHAQRARRARDGGGAAGSRQHRPGQADRHPEGGTITSREKSEVSFMTEGLIDKMSQADIANLMAFIQTGPPKTVAGTRSPSK